MSKFVIYSLIILNDKMDGLVVRLNTLSSKIVFKFVYIFNTVDYDRYNQIPILCL